MIPHRLYVGTIGEGLFRSLDHGENFRRACDGVFVECAVRAIAVHPLQPEVMYLGTEVGLYVSRDGAGNWEPLPAPLDGYQVWSINLTAARPERIVIGTRPAGKNAYHMGDQVQLVVKIRNVGKEPRTCCARRRNSWIAAR